MVVACKGEESGYSTIQKRSLCETVVGEAMEYVPKQKLTRVIISILESEAKAKDPAGVELLPHSA
jgi:hypothetical protein